MSHPPPAPHCTPVFLDHVRFAFREPVEGVEQALVEWVCANWADLEAPFSADEVEFTRTDRAGNFSERREWTFRGLPLFVVLVQGRTTAGVSHAIIDGTSCRLVRSEAFADLAGIADRRGWLAKRVDLAVDDDSGEWNPDRIEQAYDAGVLAPLGGGAPRALDVRDPRRATARIGWTVYVGVRGGAQFMRSYDKHAERLAKLGTAQGVPVGRVRHELELRAVKNGARLPWDVLRDPAPYFASHSVFLGALAGGVDPRRIGRVVRDEREAMLLALLGHCRNAYGAAIEQAFWAYGGDDTAARVVLDLLRRPGAEPAVPGVAEVAGGGRPDREFMPST